MEVVCLNTCVDIEMYLLWNRHLLHTCVSFKVYSVEFKVCYCLWHWPDVKLYFSARVEFYVDLLFIISAINWIGQYSNVLSLSGWCVTLPNTAPTLPRTEGIQTLLILCMDDVPLYVIWIHSMSFSENPFQILFKKYEAGFYLLIWQMVLFFWPKLWTYWYVKFPKKKNCDHLESESMHPFVWDSNVYKNILDNYFTLFCRLIRITIHCVAAQLKMLLLFIFQQLSKA